MSNNKFEDNFNKEEETIEEEKNPVEQVKKPRKKREMTPERKKQLLLNLAKGRETAKKNRQKTAQYKKVMKSKERQKVDDVLEEDYKQRNNKKDNEEKYNKQIKELQDKLKFFLDKEELEKSKKDIVDNSNDRTYENKEKETKLKEDIKEVKEQIKVKENEPLSDEEFFDMPKPKPKEIVKEIKQEPIKPTYKQRLKLGSIWK